MNKRIFISLLFVPIIHACGYGEREVTVQSCDDSVTISECKWQGQLFSCVVENRTDKTFAGLPIWKYDPQGKLIEKAPYRYGTGILPGESRREKLPVTKYNQDVTSRVIFCRKEPE